MKKILFTICITLYSLFSIAQSFEGKIVYHNTFKSKSPTLSDQQLSDMMGSIQNYYVKGGNYKSETNGKFVLWQLYINSDNKLYNKIANSEAILWNDGAANADEVLRSEIHKGVATVLGYKCDELVLICKSGVQKYYFNSKVPVNSALYTKHQFGNWYTIISITKSLPLKMTIDNAQFSMVSIATAVTPMHLEAALFTLPAGVKIAKSPY